MSDHNPLTDPLAGDSVVARIGDEYVTRTVRRAQKGAFCATDIDYDDSRFVETRSCYLSAWRAWCRNNKAEVVRDEA